ncbi:hypothetical protein BRARA_D01238 [Brassica rapa]|uniref:Uncharacterized protein n=1 Tax=Brassica campestris TaxID=3711 RepID=A0A397ZKB0_BRACM|nr:hypothetical protein BRARA_D01238 [Brassica rapa]
MNLMRIIRSMRLANQSPLEDSRQRVLNGGSGQVFFDAHYKRIAEAKKAQPESVAVLLNTLETLTKDEVVKEEESDETELVLCGEELVSSIEKDEEEEPKRTSEQEDVVEAKTVIEDDLQAVIEVLDGLEEKENHAEDESSSVEEERKSVTKNSSLFRSEAPDKAMELVVTRKTSDNLMKNKEKPVRQKFSLLKFLMGNNTKSLSLRLNVRTPREREIRNQTNHFYVFASTLMWSGKQKGQPKLRRGISENKR